MSFVCDDTKSNLGLNACNKLPGLFKTMIETPDGFVIPAATAADPAALETFLQAKLLAVPGVRIFLWPDFDQFTDQSEAAVYQQTPLSYRKVRDGKYMFLFGITQNLCLHKAMFTHRARTGRILTLDDQNQLFGTLNSDGDVIGFKLEMLDTQKLKFNDGSVATESPIMVVLRNNLEIDQHGVLMDGSFVPSLTRLVDVTITQVSGAASKIIVSVKQSCDGTAVSGLVAGDFILKKADGTSQTITSLTEAAGVYTLNGSSLVTGTVALVVAASLSIPGYEAPVSPVVVTVPFP